ncbi:GGDEF domain-containing protein [Sporosarcina sp. P33]|uniref:tetratricopeptide repeat-containing diguanylate cyclase n=1 Tax=Sporosarcina sp. P33 TaxID=1930764 RepID=UPI0009BF0C67|nr:GGDEF domain-containing protein [Sporosarcina sp. P33]ARD48954.1 hypothetical protein SporoP33_12420 [Sporosarcina sp. P33]
MKRREELSTIYRTINQLRNNGEYTLVISQAENLLNKGLVFSDKDAVLSAHYICAVTHYYTGDFAKVLFHIEEHHSQCLLYGSKSDWMRSYYLQYFVCSFAMDFDKGQKLLEDMLKIALETENYPYVTMAYSNLSHLFNKKEQYEEALKFAQLAVFYAGEDEVDRTILFIRAHLHLAEAAINLSQSDLAARSIEYADQLSAMDNFPREKTTLKILKARIHELSGDLPKAFHYYTAAKEIEEQLQDYSLLKDIQQKRITLAETICNFDELAVIQKEYIDLLHELEDSHWVKAALELQIRLQNSSSKTSEHIDYLTGVYNRKYLEEAANAWLLEAAETKESIVCIAFDIDNLKFINDTFGHLAGDEAIKFVAHICSNEIRKNDVLGRFGGDEFVLVMKDITLENAKKKAGLLANQIKNLSLDSKELPSPVTISVGLSDNMMREVYNFKDLFHLADLALYQAKKNGKNQVVSFI